MKNSRIALLILLLAITSAPQVLAETFEQALGTDGVKSVVRKSIAAFSDMTIANEAISIVPDSEFEREVVILSGRVQVKDSANAEAILYVRFTLFLNDFRAFLENGSSTEKRGVASGSLFSSPVARHAVLSSQQGGNPRRVIYFTLKALKEFLASLKPSQKCGRVPCSMNCEPCNDACDRCQKP